MKILTYVGDSLRLACVVRAREGSLTPLDLVGAGVVFKATSSSGAANITLEKTVGAGITVEAAAGSFHIDLTPADTASLGVQGGTFKFSVRVLVDVNHAHTVSIGTLVVQQQPV